MDLNFHIYSITIKEQLLMVLGQPFGTNPQAAGVGVVSSSYEAILLSNE